MFLLAQRRATEHLYPHNKKCARFNLSKRGWIPGPHFASPHNGHRSEHFPMIHHKIDLWKMFLCVFYRNGISHQNIVKITFSHNKMFSDRTPTHTKYSIFRLEEKEGKCLLRKENKLFFIVFWATFDFLMWLQPHIIPSAYFPVAPHSRAVHRPFFIAKYFWFTGIRGCSILLCKEICHWWQRIELLLSRVYTKLCRESGMNVWWVSNFEGAGLFCNIPKALSIDELWAFYRSWRHHPKVKWLKVKAPLKCRWTPLK